MANIGEPIRIWEIEPVEEPTRRTIEQPTEQPDEVEEPEYAPIRREHQ